MNPEPTPSTAEVTEVLQVLEAGQVTEPDEALTAEDLIEEVSIDGMCGVY